MNTPKCRILSLVFTVLCFKKSLLIRIIIIIIILLLLLLLLLLLFFDIRVRHPHADSYRDLSPKQIYRIHENEKNRKYNSRVTEIEQGTFTPLVFTTTGRMADECLRYHSRLAELLSAKRHESYATTISWVRAKVSFAILRSALLYLRGSRTQRGRNLDVKDRNQEIEKGEAGLP